MVPPPHSIRDIFDAIGFACHQAQDKADRPPLYMGECCFFDELENTPVGVDAYPEYTLELTSLKTGKLGIKVKRISK